MSNLGKREHQSGLQDQNHDQVHLDQCKPDSTATQQEGSGILHTLPGLQYGLQWGNGQDIKRTSTKKNTRNISQMDTQKTQW